MPDHGGAQGRADTWRPERAAPWRPTFVWPESFIRLIRSVGRYLRAWVLAEIGAGRLVPWLAVGFGTGIVLYFTADREPAMWAAALAALAAIAATIAARRSPIGFPVTLALAVIASGFAAATLKRIIIAHPVIQSPAWSVQIAGFVETREERERSDRIVLAVERIEGARLSENPERVRLSVRKGMAPPVGSFVQLKARLAPPLEPLSPGSYDFARDMYFHGIGASGFVLGRIQITKPPAEGGFWVRYLAMIDDMRSAIDQRIRAVLPGDKGAIASALITGSQDAISTPVNDAMFISGLGHVLSISGFHMVVVVGIVFFVVRASFALIPTFGRFAIKKWAAVAAFAAATFYLLLSGAQVATQRSYIMIAIVLIGVMLDRPTLTLRTLTVATFGVLLLAPESVVHPSFQMSFAATLALVAGYAGGVRWMSSGADTPLGARLALWGAREMTSLLLSSFVAGSATTIYAAYHFHRLAPYGALANLLAMPVVSAWVMPMGIAGALLVPFGFDGIFWQLMGHGLDWMIAVAFWVTSLPGAVGRITAFGVGPLLLGTAGLIVLCLLKSPLRYGGAALIAIAAVWAVRTPQPDVLVAPNGEAVAVRTASGRFAMFKSGSDTFAFQLWLAADADGRTAKDKTLGDGLSCDREGCVGRLADGSIVAISRTNGALEEDCRRANLVIATRTVPADCGALAIDNKTSERYGALALRRAGDGWRIEAARPDGYARPWARSARQNDNPAQPRIVPAQPRDATPRPEDLDPGD